MAHLSGKVLVIAGAKMRERRNRLETMLLFTNQSSDSVSGDLFVAVVK